MMTYHIIDTRSRDGIAELKHYTFNELKAYFEPDKKELPEHHEAWKKIENLEDLKEYLIFEADGMEQPYILEIDQVKNVEEMKKANQFFVQTR